MRNYNYKNFMKKYNINGMRIENAPNFGTEYIVEVDDNLYSIANRFNTTVENLIKLNNLNSNVVYPGEIIIVDDRYNPDKPSVYKKYTVKADDTIYTIAYNFNMTVRELKILNDLLLNKVTPGQVLIVNNVPGLLSQKENYVIKKGDSLYSIAKKFNTTVEKIKSLNNLTSNLIHIDDQLVIPDETHDGEFLKYIVLPGDSLYSIAQKKNITVEKIKDINNLTSDKLYIGQELLI